MTEINEHTVPGTDAAEKENAPVTVKAETAVSDPKPVTWKIFTLLTLSFIAAAWYGFGHTSILEVVDPYHGPGIGLTVTHWTLTAAVLLFARIRKTLKITRDGAFLLILSLLLSAVYGIYANTVMKALNLPVLLLSSGQALFTLTGHNGFLSSFRPGTVGRLPAVFRKPGEQLGCSRSLHDPAKEERGGKTGQNRAGDLWNLCCRYRRCPGSEYALQRG